ncbi:dienelactone hydrolase family protein [Neobacillus rhizosphaerae]|uniref:alpha/beta hydrolase n=1 Tax=Neobacillus rhizosphaerae TaxID=2880965 RepID=UPI003D26DA25
MFLFKEEHLTGFEVRKSIIKEGYSIRKLYYENPYKRGVQAYLFVPNQTTSHPAVIFMHPWQDDRKSFYKEAQLLAEKGFVSLIIESSFLGGCHQEGKQYKKFIQSIESLADIQNYTRMIMDIRRGITLLTKQKFVDANRMAYVGHGFGAAWGGVLAGIENRIKTFVLIAGASKTSAWHMTSEHPLAVLIRSFLPPERFDFFISDLRKFDATHYIKNTAPASIYFQFAKNDEYVDYDQASSFYSAASSPKKISWYQTDHGFSQCEEAFLDRHNWLLEKIGLPNDIYVTE